MNVRKRRDPLVGRDIEVRSINGVVYRGVVRRIRDGHELGELFELGSREDPAYRRFVYVTDRPLQVRRREG